MAKYIEGSEVKFTPNDRIFVDAEFYTGEKLTGLELHRLFPITGLDRYISVVKPDGEELGIIRNVADLMPESQQVVRDCLREYFMMPRILKFIKMSTKFKIWMWTAETDKGVFTFEIKDHLTAIKPLYDGRVLIKDINDNRYEIRDWRKLDKRSRKMIEPKI